MQLISVSVEELRHAASKLDDARVGAAGWDSLFTVSFTDHPDLSLAFAEFVGCMSDCWAEHSRAVEALARGLREAADLFENTDADAQTEIHALDADQGWMLP